MNNTHTSATWFSTRVLQWFASHGRHDLPWKEPRSPYHIWISEIMLQQTQVATVIPYFLRFIARFPTVDALANAPLDHVLHHWAGLGYYARAKNLHRAAQIIQQTWNSCFPTAIDIWQTLPGIGRSTAGAIISQSLNQRAPILDGNVKRVLCRFEGIDGWPGRPAVETILWERSEYYTPKAHAADYTQAMMDLGATCCTRTRPRCTVCPIASRCYAYIHHKQDVLPQKKPSQTLPTKKTHVLIVQTHCGHLLLTQRPLKGIWSGLWTFPEFSTMTQLRQFIEQYQLMSATALQKMSPIQHAFSHYRLHLFPHRLHMKKKLKNFDTFSWVNAQQYQHIGVPAPIQTMIRTIGVF